MKENWIILKAEDLHAYLLPEQLTSLTKRVNDSVLEQIFEDVAMRVRAEVHAYEENFLDDDPLAIPPVMRKSACYLAIEALQGRIPSVTLNNDQKFRIKEAYSFLKRVAKGEVKIPMPKNFVHDHVGYASHARMQAIERKSKRVNKNNLKGL